MSIEGVSAVVVSEVGPFVIEKLARIRRHICSYCQAYTIHLEGGANEKHKVKAKGHETEGVPSALDLLLNCKQIYNEAAGIAYSKLSLTLNTVRQKRKVRLALEGYDEGSARLTILPTTFAKELRATTRSHVTRMYFRDFRSMCDLSEYSSMERYNLTGADAERDNCTENCLRYATWNQLVHRAFHNVRTITIDLSNDYVSDSRFARLKAEANWLSLVLQPNGVSWLLKAFSNLEESVVRRENGEQQVSYVRDGMIFAAGSGMPLGGHKDVEQGFLLLHYLSSLFTWPVSVTYWEAYKHGTKDWWEAFGSYLHLAFIHLGLMHAEFVVFTVVMPCFM